VSYLQNIQSLTTDNLGGLITVKVIRKADVLSIPDPVRGVVYGNITFKPGVTGFVTWAATLETPSLESRGSKTREGERKDNRLRVQIPKDKPELRYMLEQATKDEFILLFTDGSGQQKLAGLLHTPFRFTFDHNTGSRFADGNFYTGLFYFEGPDNTYFYNGTAGLPPTGPASSVVYFNDAPIAILTAGQELRLYSDFGFTNFFTSTP
jgi:hypothetical protein